MSRWQQFYDMAAAQFAVTFAQNRTLSDDDRKAAAGRYATAAAVFADAFFANEYPRSVEGCKMPPAQFVTERGGRGGDLVLGPMGIDGSFRPNRTVDPTPDERPAQREAKPTAPLEPETSTS
jgi:hypothetical protein